MTAEHLSLDALVRATMGMRPPTPDEIRHQERQLCSTELLILAGRSADQDAAGVLIEAAVAISRRQVA